MVAQMITRLGYCSLGRSHGPRNCTKGLSAPLVPLVIRVEQPNKRTRV
jgi:hypothetical protein